MDTDVSQVGWMPVALNNAVQAGSAIRVIAGTDDIALWRGKDGVAHAWENRCPHRGMRLSYGTVCGNRLRCLYHGWIYDGSGTCVAIPAHPDLTPPQTIKVRTYRCVEAGALIWVSDGDISAPAIDGHWTPCRSLHIAVAMPDLPEILKWTKVNSVRPLSTYAADVALPDQGRLILAVHPMGSKGAMLHCALPASARRDSLLSASHWLGELRSRIEQAAVV